jgi:hypothetical protein
MVPTPNQGITSQGENSERISGPHYASFNNDVNGDRLRELKYHKLIPLIGNKLSM